MSSTPYGASTPSTTPRPPPYYASTAHTSSPQPRHRPSPTPSFTPTMRDRQARGKDPFGASSKDPFPSGDFQHRQGGGGRGGSGGRRHSDSEGDDDENTGFIGGTGPRGGGGASERQRGETFEAFRRREWARDVLESPEMLMWYASSREDVRGSGGRRHSDSEGDDDENTGFIGGTGPGSGGASERQRGETFEAFRRREWARDVLESPEMLMWYASSREDSIPGTRLFFTRVLCGFEEDHVPPQESTQRKSSGSGPGRPHGHKRR
ncbi:hypothetical protein BN1723_002970 [Verticillium longisporum]|uniref:Uncharacterized protein n=1 Tax=Verticillium longisporum TaxID=100787 RepID=A0A0G4LMD1_VERLO|nr:hypothetical protein BN1723_002970 [Verticillium longisporum]